MKQTIDSSLRNESANWWNNLDKDIQVSFGLKYPYDDVESIYQQETNPKAIIGSGVEENTDTWEHHYQDGNIMIVPSDARAAIAMVYNNRYFSAKKNADLICEAVNNYQSLREELGLLKIENEHHKTLLNSCESALEKSNTSVSSLRDSNAELLECINIMQMVINAKGFLTVLATERISDAIQKAKSLNQ